MASKCKDNKEVHFSEDALTGEGEDDRNKRFKEKHSLDSDEEDDNTKYDVLAEDDIEGQEDATIDFDENIQITPFNMKEEMEEGHFDTDGTYIFDKTKEIHDSWMDDIDWVKVKHLTSEEAAKKRAFQSGDSSDDSDDDKQNKTSEIETYEEIMTILEEGETIQKAIRRLGKNRSNIPSASQRWKKKKLKESSKSSDVDEAVVEKAKEEQKTMLRLTELSDLLVQRGIMDIYETPYERLRFTLKQLKTSRLTIAESMKDDDALDMFADDFDSKEAVKIQSDPGDQVSKDSVFKVPDVPTPSESVKAPPEDNRVMWEYREENTEDAVVKGPYSNSQMIKWADDGTFGKGVFCRKVNSGGQEGQFYNSARIDFELYE